jgi:hypothetical protein
MFAMVGCPDAEKNAWKTTIPVGKRRKTPT